MESVLTWVDARGGG